MLGGGDRTTGVVAGDKAYAGVVRSRACQRHADLLGIVRGDGDGPPGGSAKNIETAVANRSTDSLKARAVPPGWDRERLR